MNSIVSDFKKVIASMRGKTGIEIYLDESIKTLFPFDSEGHRLEIARRLSEKDNDKLFKYQKYPLIALFMDIPEEVSDGMVHYTCVVGILNLTEADYTTEERYEKNFFPILYPLYYQFLTALREVGNFAWSGDQSAPPHTKLDRPFWGTAGSEGNDGYFFNDKLDGVEITNLRINKRINTCQ